MSTALSNYLIIGFLLIIFVLLIFFLLRRSVNKYDYFRGDRNVHWFQIGASIITNNLAFDYIVSSSSNGFQTGLAFGTYEWTAAFVMVFVAIYIHPKFLSAGITTLPEYLQLRFNKWSRMLMAMLFVLLNFTMLSLILYYNGVFIEQLLNIPKTYSILLIGLLGTVIVYFGGTYAKMKVELVVFLVFIVTMCIILVLSLVEIGGIDKLIAGANGRMRVALPADDPHLPWTSVFLGGLWLLHIKYWAFFQPIMQNTLHSNTLTSTQKGYLFAATIKLFTPFLMILPGIICYELYAAEVLETDSALAVLIKNIAPGLTGKFIIAGLILTMVTTYLGYFNSLSVVLARDICAVWTNNTENPEILKKYVRRSAVLFMIMLSISSYLFSKESTVFKFSQVLFLCIAPVSVSVFVIALVSKRTPALAINVTMILGLPLFFILMTYFPYNLLDVSGITFLILASFLLIWRYVHPTIAPVIVYEKFTIKFERNLAIVIWGIFLVTGVMGIYMILL